MESNGGAGVVPAPAAIVALFAPTVVSLLVCCAFILPIKRWNMSYLLSAYGIHLHHPLSIQFFTAHMNHLLEYYMQQNSCLLKASMVVGFQLGYTVIFGSYASFSFVRTGHIAAPLGVDLNHCLTAAEFKCHDEFNYFSATGNC
ncbi:putative CAAX prenyl protease 2 [Helianthus annuus]|uniref:CAAX prenyl protease 2 n=1 Tax=Helianthus annuus TaxID=4232 RepID=A0A251TS35_HELAN|nr:CAAX prenyl protease 2 [Helianthus annuus]KAF5823789.1 putative CAAX prenyl protease 2 [Helianthus annuus]KAJ0613074.1 putative CAAX prenyl protease 2 [Helianthus annuus]KAJ0624781.1 putative CAAX prenyl protease 2 [Helianthus annuus]KAJ0784748.1 putative CAAX prenyl protease 2 [Helianthus annuus]KAJ0949846.1 putative CAAX prenyl protease 2 [Helianthus annuus]